MSFILGLLPHKFRLKENSQSQQTTMDGSRDKSATDVDNNKSKELKPTAGNLS